jgi:hypothetical protein
MEKKKEQPMWLDYNVKLQMTGQFAASLPRTLDQIQSMLENRMPTNPPADYVPIQELAQQVLGRVIKPEETEGEENPPEDKEKLKFGWATFCHNDQGLYYEGRCIRGHIKDCATQIRSFFTNPKTGASVPLKAWVANKVYVLTDEIYLMNGKTPIKEISGTQQRFVQVMTPPGPRSTIKFIDYVDKPELNFALRVLNDGVITPQIIEALFTYGSIHGAGQERSQGWGRYTYTISPASL